MLVLSLKPLKKLTGTDRHAGRQADGQDHALNQADALTKKEAIRNNDNLKNKDNLIKSIPIIFQGFSTFESSKIMPRTASWNYKECDL